MFSQTSEQHTYAIYMISRALFSSFLRNCVPFFAHGIQFDENKRFFLSSRAFSSHSPSPRLSTSFQEHLCSRRRNSICEGISRGNSTRPRTADPRIVDCPIDTILGEIKGSTFAAISRSTPRDKTYFRRRRIHQRLKSRFHYFVKSRVYAEFYA